MENYPPRELAERDRAIAYWTDQQIWNKPNSSKQSIKRQRSRSKQIQQSDNRESRSLRKVAETKFFQGLIIGTWYNANFN